jgi:hypothetical protein
MAAGQQPGGSWPEGVSDLLAELRELTRVVQDGDGSSLEDVAIGRQDKFAELFGALDRRMTGHGTPQPAPPGVIHVLSWSHRQGETITAHATAELAEAAAARIARRNWHEAAGRVSAGYLPVIPAGLADAEVTRLYFEAMADLESYVITAAGVEGAGEPATSALPGPGDFPAWLARHGVLMHAGTRPDRVATGVEIDLPILHAAIRGLIRQGEPGPGPAARPITRHGIPAREHARAGDARPDEQASQFVREVAENCVVAEDFTGGNLVFNELVRAAREVAAALGIHYTPGEGHGYAGLPELDDDDRAVTAARRHLPGDPDAGLMPGTDVGGIQVTAWRERGELQVDVLLEDADPEAWVTEAGEVGVTITVAGLVVYQGRQVIADACERCGASTADSEGYDGKCGNCADQDHAAQEAAEGRGGDGG